MTLVVVVDGQEKERGERKGEKWKEMIVGRGGKLEAGSCALR